MAEQPDALAISEKWHDSIVVLNVVGKVNRRTADTFRRALRRALEATDRLVVNMQNASDLNGAAREQLVETKKEVTRRGGGIAVISPHKTDKLSDILALQTDIFIAKDEQEALDHLRSGPTKKQIA